MSTPSCFLLFLVILCLSLHACSARHHGAVNNKKKLHFPIENGLKKNSVVVLLQAAKSTSSKEPSRSIKEESNLVGDVKHKTVKNKKEKKGSGVSVTWRVPHKKHEEKNPGFNLDYSPPKTHPPSHN